MRKLDAAARKARAELIERRTRVRELSPQQRKAMRAQAAAIIRRRIERGRV